MPQDLNPLNTLLDGTDDKKASVQCIMNSAAPGEFSSVRADGKKVTCAVLWKQRSAKVPGRLVPCQKYSLYLKDPPDGWSYCELFMQWLEFFFVPEVRPSETALGCVVFIVDAPRPILPCPT